MAIKLLKSDATASRNPKKAQIICKSLRRKIVLGEYAKDDKLPSEVDLIKIYNASRPSVREALRLLEAEGLIVIIRGAHGGARVSDPGVTTMALSTGVYMQMNDITVGDVYRARMAIEPPAVKILAEARDPNIVKILRDQIEKERDTLSDVDVLVQGTVRFHYLLVELSQNKTLTMFMKIILSIIEAHYAKVVTGGDVVTREIIRAKRRVIASQEHVVDLIEAGMAVEAEEYWLTHMDKAGVLLLQKNGRRVVDLFS